MNRIMIKFHSPAASVIKDDGNGLGDRFGQVLIGADFAGSLGSFGKQFLIER